MEEGIVACVIEVQVLPDVLVNILSFDLEEKVVEEFALFLIDLLKVIVVELVHQQLAEFEDVHVSVHQLDQLEDILVHVDGCQILTEDHTVGVQRTGDQLMEVLFLPCSHELHVDTVAQVLHCLAKDRVVHML